MAAEVEELYTSIVTVDDRNDARQRQQGFARAMENVLVKVTGNVELRQNNAIRRALNNPDEFIDSWAYRTLEVDQAGSADSGDLNEEVEPIIQLEVTFFEPQILELLDSSSIPIWPSNRPETLVWITVQEELSAKSLVTTVSGQNTELAEKVSSLASESGLPILFPLGDFDDQRNISLDQAWNMNQEALERASSRYGSESILALRIYQSLSGEILGSSRYLFRNRQYEYSSFDEPLDTFIRNSLSMAVEELSGYYAVLLSGTQSKVQVNFTVEGVDQLKDYSSLMAYVEQLTDVNDVSIVSINTDTVELLLYTGGQIRQLVESIALNNKLVQIDELTRIGNQVYMRYRWNEQ